MYIASKLDKTKNYSKLTPYETLPVEKTAMYKGNFVQTNKTEQSSKVKSTLFTILIFCCHMRETFK